jgi:hypothetical protein
MQDAIAVNCFDCGENCNPWRRQKTIIDKGDAIRERLPPIKGYFVASIAAAVISAYDVGQAEMVSDLCRDAEMLRRVSLRHVPVTCF